MLDIPLIVFEGIDHSGKTTLSKKLAELYTDFRWSKEPVFPSSMADRLNSDEFRDKPAKREVLFLKGRLAKQSLYRSTPVFLDRYLWSGLAYAKAFSPSIYPFVQELYQEYDIFKKPTVTFFMSTPVQTCFDRREPESTETMERLTTLMQAYIDTEQYVNTPIVLVDGKKSVDECVEQCVAELKKYCPKYFV